MGRLPGGIIDAFRETIHRDVIVHPTSRRGTPTIRMGTAASGQTGMTPPSTGAGTIPPGTAPAGMRRSLQAASTDFENMDVNRSMTTATKRRMTLQEKRRQIFMASSTKIPLRPVRPTHPRNIMSFVPKKGHYASVPWTNIGGKATGVRGEYKYEINGPPSPRPMVHPPRFLPSAPGKRNVGLGTNFGLFKAPTNEPHGWEERPLSFEGSSNRMISQQHYPIQILPTVVGKS